MKKYKEKKWKRINQTDRYMKGVFFDYFVPHPADNYVKAETSKMVNDYFGADWLTAFNTLYLDGVNEKRAYLLAIRLLKKKYRLKKSNHLNEKYVYRIFYKKRY